MLLLRCLSSSQKKLRLTLFFPSGCMDLELLYFFFLALYILIMAMFHFFWSALKEIIYAYVGSF